MKFANTFLVTLNAFQIGKLYYQGHNVQYVDLFLKPSQLILALLLASLSTRVGRHTNYTQYLFCLKVVIKYLVLVITVLDQTLLVRQVCKYLVYISYCNQLYFQFQNSFIGEINVCLENFFQEFLICQGQTQFSSS